MSSEGKKLTPEALAYRSKIANNTSAVAWINDWLSQRRSMSPIVALTDAEFDLFWTFLALFILSGKLTKKGSISNPPKIPVKGVDQVWYNPIGTVVATSKDTMDANGKWILTPGRIYKISSHRQLNILLEQIGKTSESFKISDSVAAIQPEYIYLGKSWESGKTWASYFSFLGSDHLLLELGAVIKNKNPDLYNTLIVSALFQIIVVKLRGKVTILEQVNQQNIIIKQKFGIMEKRLNEFGTPSIKSAVDAYIAAGGAIPVVREKSGATSPHEILKEYFKFDFGANAYEKDKKPF
jgi:hypothetical protein